MRTEIIDGHAHLHPGSEALDRLIKRMDALGIARSVVVLGGVVPPTQLTEIVPAHAARERGLARVCDNRRILEQCARAPGRLLPFYFANPWVGPDEYREIGHEFHGLKLGPAVHGAPLLGPETQAYVEAAGELDHPIYLHCLDRDGMRVSDLVLLSEAYPKARFILGHGGVGALDFDCVDRIAPRPNIFYETSGAFLAPIRHALAKLGTDRMIFGSEHPLQSIRAELAKIHDLDLDEAGLNAVCGLNLRSLLPAQRLREAALQAVIDRARLAPYYKDRFASERVTAESWRSLPLTTKEDLRQAYPFGLLAVPKRELSGYHESSGSSGQPISSYFTADDWNDVTTRFLRSAVALSAEDMVLIKTPYSLVTTAHQMHAAAQLAGATVVPADNRSQNMPYSRVLRLLKDLPITVAWCMPSEALIWAHLARRQGLDPETDFPNLRAFLVAGEALSPARKQAIARAWGEKRVIEDYGSTETGSLAGECARGRLHLWDDRVFFEVIDGSLVVTPLYRRAMPLVRYDLEDSVRLSFDPCACGSRSAVVEVLGRRSGMLHVGAASFYPRDLEQLIYERSAELGLWFWRSRLRENSLEIEIHVEGDERAAESAIAEQVLARLGVPARVRAVPATWFLPETLLASEAPMQKPKFIFSTQDDWDRSLVYA